MDAIQNDNFNLQIRKLLKEFGVKAHSLIEKRLENDVSDCEVTLRLTIDSELTEEIKTTIKS